MGLGKDLARRSASTLLGLFAIVTLTYLIFQILLPTSVCGGQPIGACDRKIYVPEIPPRGYANATYWLNVARPSNMINFGYGQPPLPSFLTFAWSMLTLKLGYHTGSWEGGLLLGTIERVYPATVILVLASTVAGLAIAQTLGVLFPMGKGREYPLRLLGISVFFSSIPILMLIPVSYIVRGWVLGSPSAPISSQPGQSVPAILVASIVPFLVLTVVGLWASFQQKMRQILDSSKPDSSEAAVRLGLVESANLYRTSAIVRLSHYLPVFAVVFATVMSFDVVSELALNWPGLGDQLYLGMISSDYSLLQALFLVISATLLGVYFIAGVANDVSQHLAKTSAEVRALLGPR